MGGAIVGVHVYGRGVSVAGMGKLDLFFSWGEEREGGGGGWGFSNGTSLNFMYIQMEENENVF